MGTRMRKEILGFFIIFSKKLTHLPIHSATTCQGMDEKLPNMLQLARLLSTYEKKKIDERDPLMYTFLTR
jgi:hypothetical protein